MCSFNCKLDQNICHNAHPSRGFLLASHLIATNTIFVISQAICRVKASVTLMKYKTNNNQPYFALIVQEKL